MSAARAVPPNCRLCGQSTPDSTFTSQQVKWDTAFTLHGTGKEAHLVSSANGLQDVLLIKWFTLHLLGVASFG